MEIIAFIIALIAIYAVKTVAIMRNQDAEIANSMSFSWTKPGVMENVAVPEMAVETPHIAASEAWSPSLAAQRLRSNRVAIAR